MRGLPLRVEASAFLAPIALVALGCIALIRAGFETGEHTMARALAGTSRIAFQSASQQDSLIDRAVVLPLVLGQSALPDASVRLRALTPPSTSPIELPPATATPSHSTSVSDLVYADCILTKTLAIAGSQPSQVEVREYNSVSRPIRVLRFLAGRPTQTETTVYLADGVRPSMRTLDANRYGVPNQVTTWEYDTAGRPAVIVARNGDVVDYRSTLTYRRGRLVEILRERTQGLPAAIRTVYTHDEHGRLIESKRFADGRPDHAYTFKWRLGFLATWHRQVLPARFGAILSEFTYGPEGWLEEMRGYDLSDEFGKVFLSSTVYEYEEHGWLLRRTEHSYKRVESTSWLYNHLGQRISELHLSNHYPSERRDYEIDCGEG